MYINIVDFSSAYCGTNQEGYRNTGFFHRTANAHRRRNYIKSIGINGRKLEKEEEIKVGLVEAFQNLFLDPGGWSPSLPDLEINEISSEDSARLEENFSEEEIWNAISGLNSDKAPGPDGFPIALGNSMISADLSRI